MSTTLFAIDARVTVADPSSSVHGRGGTVIALRGGADGYRVRVAYDTPAVGPGGRVLEAGWYRHDELAAHPG